jgi:hypothetical protein
MLEYSFYSFNFFFKSGDYCFLRVGNVVLYKILFIILSVFKRLQTNLNSL